MQNEARKLARGEIAWTVPMRNKARQDMREAQTERLRRTLN
jgi:hypothetical protein